MTNLIFFLKRRSYAVVFLILCGFNLISAERIFDKHIIIVIDAAPSQAAKEELRNKTKVLNGLYEIFKRDSITMTDNDCYSMVFYGLRENDEDNSNYIRIIKRSNRKDRFYWRQFDGVNNKFNFRDEEWDDMIKTQRGEYFESYSMYSLQTPAKAYAIKTLKREDCEKLAKKTYLVLISDNQFNGNDNIYKELGSISQNKQKEDFISVNTDVNKKFNIKHKCEKCIGASAYLPLYITLFEVEPRFEPSFDSNVNYPNDLGLTRVKGGYRIQFEFNEANDNYLIQNLRFIYKDKNGESFTIEKQSSKFIEYKSKSLTDNKDSNLQDMITVELDKDSFENILEAEMEVSLLQIDDCYNAALFSPDNFIKLKKKVQLPLKDEVKILSTIPLPDHLWMNDNPETTVIIWNIILIIVIVILVGILVSIIIKRAITYRPKAKQISIKYIEESDKINK